VSLLSNHVNCSAKLHKLRVWQAAGGRTDDELSAGGRSKKVMVELSDTGIHSSARNRFT